MDLQNILKNVFCLLLIVVHKIDAELTKNKYTWREATQVCTLATPNLTFSECGITPDLDNLLSVDAWLGFTENMTPFEYFGCFGKKIDAKVNYTTEGDPGKCWSACNNVKLKAVAVHDKKCYCLHDTKVDTRRLLEDQCVFGCPSQPNIVCGGTNNISEYASVYKPTFTGPVKTSDSETSLCLWFDIGQKAFYWGRCTYSYRMICYNDNNVWIYNDAQNEYDDWITMTTRCFSDDGIPSNYNKTKNVYTTETAQMWTGIIRSGVIYPITNSTNVNEGKYGFVDIATGKLSFTNDTTVRKRALCVEGTVVTDETTTSTDSLNIGAIVGVTLSIAVIIIVTVIIIVLWKRGIRLQVVRKRKSDSQNETAANNDINATGHDNAIQGTPEVNVHSYDEIDISDISPGNTMTHVDGDNNSPNNYDEAHTYRNIGNPASNVVHTYLDLVNKHEGKHTYQN